MNNSTFLFGNLGRLENYFYFIWYLANTAETCGLLVGRFHPHAKLWDVGHGNWDGSSLSHLEFGIKLFKGMRSWWWSSGQRACLIIPRSEFESRLRLQFFPVKFVFEKNEINKKRPGLTYFKLLRVLGIGCCSVGRAVTSNTRGPRFVSKHRQKCIMNILTVEKTKIKKKRPWMAHSKGYRHERGIFLNRAE